MTDRTITTSTGTTVSLANNGEDTVVLLDHPSAPADMRPTEAGRVIDCGFQFTDFADWSLSPEGLRAIADLIDGGTTAISESKPIGPDGDTGTRAIVEEFRPAEVAWTYVDPIVQQAIKTATTSVKDGNGDSVYSRDNLADAIQLLVAAIQILDRPSDGEVTA